MKSNERKKNLILAFVLVLDGISKMYYLKVMNSILKLVEKYRDQDYL